MTTSWLYWFGFLGWLVLALSLISLAGLIAKNTLELNAIGKNWDWKRNMVWSITKKVEAVWGKVPIVVLCLALGWVLRDNYGLHNTHTLTNLDVVEQTAADTFIFQNGDEPVGMTFPFTFCPDAVPAIHPGYWVKIVTYENRSVPYPCHDINKAHSEKFGIIYYSERKQALSWPMEANPHRTSP